MIISICIIKENGRTVGYRLYDTEKVEYKDCSVLSVIKGIDMISNMKLSMGCEEFIGGQGHLYPVYYKDTKQYINSDNLVYIGKTVEFRHKGMYNDKQLRVLNTWVHLDKSNNTFCDCEGIEISKQAIEVQEGILNHTLLNVVESYTGGYDSKEAKRIGVNEDHVANSCFCSIADVYERYKEIKKYDIVKFRGIHYNIDGKKRVRVQKGKSNRSNGVYEVADVGLLYGMEIGYKNTEIQLHEKMPLCLGNNNIYYVDKNKQVVGEDLFSYIAGGLAEVLNGTKLLDSSRESSSCMISATEILVMTFRELIALDIDKYKEIVYSSLAKKNILSKKLKLTGLDSNIEIDNSGRVAVYKVNDGDIVTVSSQMTEFDLKNICRADGRISGVHKAAIHLRIVDDHNSVYMTGVNMNILFKSVECNDVALMKKILGKMTLGFSKEIVWKLDASKITLGLIKWICTKFCIKLEAIGSLQDRYKDKIISYLLSNNYANVEDVKNRYNSVKDDPYIFQIGMESFIYAGKKLGGEYYYNHISDLGDSVHEGNRDRREVYGVTMLRIGQGCKWDFKVSGDGNDDANITVDFDDDIVLNVSAELTRWVKAVNDIHTAAIRLGLYKSLDSSIENIYNTLNNKYNNLQEDRCEKYNLYTALGIFSSDLGYMYKRDNDKGVSILCIRDGNYIRVCIYLKYIKYGLPDEKGVAESLSSISSRWAKPGGFYPKELKGILVDKLPDCLWVNIVFDQLIFQNEMQLIKSFRAKRYGITEDLEIVNPGDYGDGNIHSVGLMFPRIIDSGNKFYKHLVKLDN